MELVILLYFSFGIYFNMSKTNTSKEKICSKTVTGKHIWQDYSRWLFEQTKQSQGSNPKYKCIACGLFDDREYEVWAKGLWWHSFLIKLVNKLKQ